jgi:hypothetical protein
MVLKYSERLKRLSFVGSFEISSIIPLLVEPEERENECLTEMLESILLELFQGKETNGRRIARFLYSGSVNITCFR